tara:strand:+ start:265 stop:576 length:312 start_codon:yes stop_codon:yes gene_type:complete
MTGPGGAAAVGTWIQTHLWQIGAAAAVLYTGYLTGQMETGAKIEAMRVKHDRDLAELEKRVITNERKLGGRFTFLAQAVPAINHLCGKDKECRNYYGYVEMPE